MNGTRRRSSPPATTGTLRTVLLVVFAWMTGPVDANARLTRVATTVQAAPKPIAVTRVGVIDGGDSTPRLDQTVVIRGNRIVAVGPSRSTAVPVGARTIDGRGKFLIPALAELVLLDANPLHDIRHTRRIAS